MTFILFRNLFSRLPPAWPPCLRFALAGLSLVVAACTEAPAPKQYLLEAPEAAAAMGLTAGRLHELGIVDQVIKEPLGGAHRDYDQAADAIRKALVKQLDALKALEIDALVDRRYDRQMSYGNVDSVPADE